MPEPPVRPVRIVRSREGTPFEGGGAGQGVFGARARNRSGYRRARRLLVAYLLAVFLLYLAILLLLVTSHYAGVREDFSAYVLFTVIASGSAMAGYVMTVGRAPWALYSTGSELVIRERFGAVRRYPMGPELGVTLIRRIGTGVFTPEPVEEIRVTFGQRSAREYLVDLGTLESLTEISRAHGSERVAQSGTPRS